MEKKIISCIHYNMDFERATPVKEVGFVVA
jgi:hypothetical protein